MNIKSRTPGMMQLAVIGGILMGMAPLSIDMYLPAFALIAAEMKSPEALVQLSLSVFLAGITIGQLFYGPVSDRIGRKKPLITGIILYVLSSLGCILTSDIRIFILFRFLQAVGAAAGMVISQVVVTDVFPDIRKASRVFSFLMVVLSVAPIVAPTIGSFLLGQSGWRSIFWVLLGIGSLNILTVIFGLPETTGPNPSVKISQSLKTYLSILKNPGFMKIASARNIANAGMFIYITASPFVFLQIFSLSEFQYGFVFAGTAGAAMAGNIVNSILLKKFDPERLFDTTMVLSLVFGLLAGVLSVISPGMIFVIVVLAGYMFTIGMMLPNSTGIALSGHGKNTGSASSLLGSLQFVAAFAASAAMSMAPIGSIKPMTIGIAVCGIIAALIHFIKRPE